MKMRNPLRGSNGFTMVELLVVVGIIGILSGIAVPTYIGAKRNGQDSQAQTSLRSALAAERTRYVDFQSYTADPAALRTLEPNLNFTTTDAAQNGVMAAVSAGTDPQTVVLVSTSESDGQFCIMNIAADLTAAVNGQTLAGTYYRRNPSTVATPPTSVGTNTCGASGYVRTDDGWNS